MGRKSEDMGRKCEGYLKDIKRTNGRDGARTEYLGGHVFNEVHSPAWGCHLICQNLGDMRPSCTPGSRIPEERTSEGHTQEIRRTLGEIWEDIGRTSGGHWEGIRRTWGEHKEDIRKTSGRHQEDIRRTSGGHQEVTPLQVSKTKKYIQRTLRRYPEKKCKHSEYILNT